MSKSKATVKKMLKNKSALSVLRYLDKYIESYDKARTLAYKAKDEGKAQFYNERISNMREIQGWICQAAKVSRDDYIYNDLFWRKK